MIATLRNELRKVRKELCPEVTLVCGPPCSGKTSYVLEHMQPGDLVVDLDAIRQALSFSDDAHELHDALMPAAYSARDAVLNRLQLGLPGVRHAWIIDCAADRIRRKALRSRFGAEAVEMTTSREQCETRAQRRPDPERTIRMIGEWYQAWGS